MKPQDWLQLAISLAARAALTPLLGRTIARVYADEPHILRTPIGWLERLIYRACGVYGSWLGAFLRWVHGGRNSVGRIPKT